MINTLNYSENLSLAGFDWSNLLQGVAQATNQLLTTSDFVAGVNLALATLGQVTGVDRVYIFQTHPHPETQETAISQRYEWVRESIEPQQDNPEMQNLVLASAGLQRWDEILSLGQPISGCIVDFPVAEQAILLSQSILSILIVPILVEEKLWGFIGFDDCQQERQWSQDELAVLRTVAATTGGTIAHRQTVENLRHSELRLQQIAANIPGMIFQFLQRPDGSRSLIYASSGCRELYELEPSAVQGSFQLLNELTHPDDREAYEQSVAISAITGEPWQWEGRCITPSGRIKWVQGVSRPERQANGDIIWDGLLIDISDRQQAKSNLRLSEERLQSFFDATFEAVIIHDRGRVLDVNSATESLYGYSAVEMIGRSVLELTAPVSRELIAQRAQLPSDQPFEAIGLKKDGTTFVAEVAAKSILYQGRSVRVAGLRDITERKQAENALRQSEARNRALVEGIPDLIFRLSADGTYLDFKAEKDSDLAAPPAQLLGKTLSEVLPTDVAQEILQHIGQALATGVMQTLEYQLVLYGQQRYWEARIVACEEVEVLVIVRDITERKRFEEKLKISAWRDRLFAEIASRIRRSLNLNQVINTAVAEVRQFLQADRVFISRTDATLNGQVFAESVAPDWESILEIFISDQSYIQELRSLLTPGVFQAIDDISQANLSSLRAEYFTRYQVKACLAVPIVLGEELLGALAVHQCDAPRHWQEWEIELVQSLATQVAIAIQQAQLYEQVQVLNANLEQQVAERTQELQQKYTELQELHQLKDVFLHAVSHDLRTPVMGWLLVLKNLLSQPTEPVPVSHSVLERMVQSSDRQLHLINSLLEVHASEVGGIVLRREPLQIQQLINAIVEDIEPLVTKNQATLLNQVPADLPLISADPAQLRRVFKNLLTNALNHNPPGVQLTLNASVEGSVIRCTVQDNGVGMSQEMCDRLGQLYVRGKEARYSSGLGLGLYLCRQIITAHGGDIQVQSRSGEGTTLAA